MIDDQTVSQSRSVGGSALLILHVWHLERGSRSHASKLCFPCNQTETVISKNTHRRSHVDLVVRSDRTEPTGRRQLLLSFNMGTCAMPVTIHHTRIMSPKVYLYLANNGRPETQGMVQFPPPKKQPSKMKLRHLQVPSTWEPSSC